VEAEARLAEAGAGLAEEDGPADAHCGCNGDDRHDRRRHDRDGQGDGEVEEPLSAAMIEGRRHLFSLSKSLADDGRLTLVAQGLRSLLAILPERCEGGRCWKRRVLHGSDSRSVGQDRA